MICVCILEAVYCFEVYFMTGAGIASRVRHCGKELHVPENLSK